ncbi:hydroxymethylglutaryl-CoA lyase [Thermanaerosceptrum fracticalcis]|uniref:Hydroxymethylglutaryl-CoA lyase n=1 Tax=Thermanaerosceptrum fracticalcis TaxID=1712410 RepID=A0A7G6E7U4_THEFR|nr:hydroxymethylglutaryl-CoA lyase [Thermanaerosceptrum fracticalcis]QNB48148.1 hydroxymethylglutaryl-CoA lyase [Thermanaerosceptrum fracticalcis]
MELPESVMIVEVGPRDGFQNIKKWIPTDVKLEVIESLIAANIQKIEVTSFVSPKAIAQMQDAKDIVSKLLEKKVNIELNALVPNLTGAVAAWNAGIKEITYVISASEKHNMENVRRTIEESFGELAKLKESLPDMKIKLDIATAFGCPFLGDIPVEQVIKIIEQGLTLEVEEICLCDTIGVANPRQTGSLLKEVLERYPGVEFGLHFHDTRGMGLANVLVALQNGMTKFEAAIGGLGGCPFAPGAAGNIATEDLVNMLERMNVKTGIDLGKLLETAKLVKAKIMSELTGHMVNVCSVL